MTDSLLIPRPLESALFGLSVFGAEVATPAEVEATVNAASKQRDVLVVVRVPTDALAAVRRLEDAGGRLCDILVTMQRRLDANRVGESPPPDGIVIRRGSAADASALEALAERAFRGFIGHWHTDPNLPVQLADTLYARWAADLARLATDNRPLLIAETREREVAGFLALESLIAGHWYVPLAAVDPQFRGRGVLRALLMTGMREIGRDTQAQIDYETQLSNRAALRVVAQCGLIPSTSRLTFHLWTKRR